MEIAVILFGLLSIGCTWTIFMTISIFNKKIGDLQKAVANLHVSFMELDSKFKVMKEEKKKQNEEHRLWRGGAVIILQKEFGTCGTHLDNSHFHDLNYRHMEEHLDTHQEYNQGSKDLLTATVWQKLIQQNRVVDQKRGGEINHNLKKTSICPL